MLWRTLLYLGGLCLWLVSWRTLLYLEDFAMLGWYLATFGGNSCWVMFGGFVKACLPWGFATFGGDSWRMMTWRLCYLGDIAIFGGSYYTWRLGVGGCFAWCLGDYATLIDILEGFYYTWRWLLLVGDLPFYWILDYVALGHRWCFGGHCYILEDYAFGWCLGGHYYTWRTLLCLVGVLLYLEVTFVGWCCGDFAPLGFGIWRLNLWCARWLWLMLWRLWRWLLWLMLWRLWRSFIWLSSWWPWYISALVLEDTFRPLSWSIHFGPNPEGTHFGLDLGGHISAQS